jgi:Na+-transporting NADH:ubiquinone oxidoreductase subunit NqrB
MRTTRGPLAAGWAWFWSDPRHGQIATLATLLTYGTSRLGFDIALPQVAVTIASALAAQAGFEWAIAGRPSVSGLKSALVSSLSLCLLLRTDVLALAAVGSVMAVGSKFTVRVGNKHLFNPTNIALVVLVAVSDRVWISPGQWGSETALAFLFASAGLMVVHRAARADVTLAFMACYAALLVGRSVWLNEPLTIPLHRLEGGAFLLFSFFMISDPKTTPDSRWGRILFASLVAAGAANVQFRLFRTNGFLWALACASPLVPLLDWRFPDARYDWSGSRAATRPTRPATVPAAAPSLSPRLHPTHGGLR